MEKKPKPEAVRVVVPPRAMPGSFDPYAINPVADGPTGGFAYATTGTHNIPMPDSSFWRMNKQMQTVEDETDLPTQEFVTIDYVRNRVDPHFLIHGKTGDVFIRADGAPWEWPGYRVSRDGAGETVAQPWTAMDDAHVIKPDGSEETVANKDRGGFKPKRSRRRAA